jgi:hypothetical protein
MRPDDLTNRDAILGRCEDILRQGYFLEPSFTVTNPFYLSVDPYVLLQSVLHFGNPST